MGVAAAIDGTSDFGMLARDLKDKEIEGLGKDYQAFLVAKDALTVSVNAENPICEKLDDMEGGIAPVILGSLMFTGLSVIFAFPPALAIALLIVFELQNERIRSLLRAFIQLSSGIPSIVLGLFTYSFLVRKLELGRSVFAASVALALMILPFIEQRAEKAFLEIHASPWLASRALGCSRRYSLLHLVIPACKGELVSNEKYFEN